MHLTKRETQIIDLIKQSKTTSEIAQILGTRYKTVDNQRAALYKKMGVSTVVELIAKLSAPQTVDERILDTLNQILKELRKYTK